MKTIALFFGGPGNEAKVSIMSAQYVATHFDYKKYKLILIYWSRNKNFYIVDNFFDIKKPSNRIKEDQFKGVFDIALLMTHGKYGEDGALQRILEKAKVQYCGSGVKASALCMDKARTKKLLVKHHIKQVRFEVINLNITTTKQIDKKINIIKNNYELPLFVKPANSGSSVGITKVVKFSQLPKAIKTASLYDKKILIEQGLVNPREIEVGVLGNKKLTISEPGELILSKQFYDYNDKYISNKTKISIPAKLTSTEIYKIKKLAAKVYRICDCGGFARIDFFITNNTIYFNEINTLPGFTKFSMYPNLMMNMGMSFKQLLSKIITLA